MFDPNKNIQENLQNFFSKEASVLENTLKKALNIDCLIKFTKAKTTTASQKKDFFGTFDLSINDTTLGLHVSIDAKIGSILSDLMLMGPGEAKNNLEAEDIDSLKELFSQSFGAFATTIREEGLISSFNGFSSKEFDTKEVYEAEFEIIISNIAESLILQYLSVQEFESLMNSIKVEIQSKTDQDQVPIFEIEENSKTNTHKEIPSDNLNLLMDIDLTARVRIGSKQMLLKDIVKLSEGTIIDLDKNVDQPMEILVNGKTIAKGIVVVVGGNFGIKITHVGTKEERIKSLGGENGKL